METKKNQWIGWVYLAPAIILMLVFMAFPLIITTIVAFRNDYRIGFGLLQLVYPADGFDGIQSYFSGLNYGFGAFRTVFKNEYFWSYYMVNTLIIVFVSVPLTITLSLLIAVALNSIKKLQKFFQTIFFMPYVTNSIALGMVFAVMFGSNPNGLINSLLISMGNNAIDWLGAATDGNASPLMIRFTGMAVLIIYIVWQALPFKILILLSGLQGIDKQYYQAAQIDGTSKFRTLMRITVPLLSPQIIYLMITSFIGSFKEYNSVVALFNKDGYPVTGANIPYFGTIVLYIYNNVVMMPHVASAAALILFVIILLFTGLNSWISNKFVHY